MIKKSKVSTDMDKAFAQLIENCEKPLENFKLSRSDPGEKSSGWGAYLTLGNKEQAEYDAWRASLTPKMIEQILKKAYHMVQLISQREERA